MYYATFTKRVEGKDSEGNLTGEWTLGYTNPIPLRASLTRGHGTTTAESY